MTVLIRVRRHNRGRRPRTKERTVIRGGRDPFRNGLERDELVDNGARNRLRS